MQPSTSVWQRIERKAAELGRALIEGVDRDAEAYVQVMKGYRMPKN